MSLSLTARYIRIATVYTFHTGIATRRVWDNHGMTPKALKALHTTAVYAIASALFVWWFLNQSEWSKDVKHISSSPSQALDLVEEIEQQMNQQPDTTTTEPIDYGKFVERYVRYDMESHGMPQPQPDMSWTKPDLVSACRAYGLKPTGNKSALLERLQVRLA